MTQAQLARKLARMNVGYQQPAGLRAYLGHTEPARAFDPLALLAEEQDHRRERLAEELLKIGLEDVTWESSANDDEEQKNATRALVCMARACLAAATVLYPEIPEEGKAFEVPGEPLAALPAEAFEGVQSVTPEYKGGGE